MYCVILIEKEKGRFERRFLICYFCLNVWKMEIKEEMFVI